jgi:UPF0716 protein FxsA
MQGFPVLFLLFLSVPLAEIWLLIKVGGVIGGGWTILLVVATALVGAALVRAQGLSLWSRIQGELARGAMPAEEMLRGLVLLLAGALLLTPGLITDTVGFVLLLPPFQRFVIQQFLARKGATVVSSGNYSARIVEAEYRREDR